MAKGKDLEKNWSR